MRGFQGSPSCTFGKTPSLRERTDLSPHLELGILGSGSKLVRPMFQEGLFGHMAQVRLLLNVGAPSGRYFISRGILHSVAIDMSSPGAHWLGRTHELAATNCEPSLSRLSWPCVSKEGLEVFADIAHLPVHICNGLVVCGKRGYQVNPFVETGFLEDLAPQGTFEVKLRVLGSSWSTLTTSSPVMFQCSYSG